VLVYCAGIFVQFVLRNGYGRLVYLVHMFLVPR